MIRPVLPCTACQNTVDSKPKSKHENDCKAIEEHHAHHADDLLHCPKLSFNLALYNLDDTYPPTLFSVRLVSVTFPLGLTALLRVLPLTAAASPELSCNG